MRTITLVNAIINQEQEKLQKPYKINELAFKNYEKTLMLLAQLKGKGKCNFTYESQFQPYISHCIEIEWTDNDDIIELDTKDIMFVLECMDTMIIDKTDNSGKWQLYSKLYIKS